MKRYKLKDGEHEFVVDVEKKSDLKKLDFWKDKKNLVEEDVSSELAARKSLIELKKQFIELQNDQAVLEAELKRMQEIKKGSE